MIHSIVSVGRGGTRSAAAASLAGAAAFLLFVTTSVFTAVPATAQQIVALVNGEPITSLDVDNRTRLITAFSRRQPPRKEVVDELIDQKVKLRQAKRLDIDITDAMVERAFASIGSQSGRNSAQLAAALREAGIDPQSFKTKLRADLAWREVLKQMSPGTFQVRRQRRQCSTRCVRSCSSFRAGRPRRLPPRAPARLKLCARSSRIASATLRLPENIPKW
jgi:hypothetical protein